MKRLGTWLAVIVALGFLAVAAACAYAILPNGTERPTAASDLGEAFLARASLKLAAAGSAEQFMLAGASFYDRPTPWGGFLCEMRTYRVPAWIGGTQRYGPLSQRMYLIKMDTKGSEYDSRAKTCANPLDPHQLVFGDGRDIESAAVTLNAASRLARGGAVPFKVTCIDRRDSIEGSACDGMDLLRQFKMSSIRQVWPYQETHSPSNIAGAERTRVVFMHAAYFGGGCGQSESLAFELIDGPLPSPALREIHIAWDRPC